MRLATGAEAAKKRPTKIQGRGWWRLFFLGKGKASEDCDIYIHILFIAVNKKKLFSDGLPRVVNTPDTLLKNVFFQFYFAF